MIFYFFGCLSEIFRFFKFYCVQKLNFLIDLFSSSREVNIMTTKKHFFAREEHRQLVFNWMHVCIISSSSWECCLFNCCKICSQGWKKLSASFLLALLLERNKFRRFSFVWTCPWHQNIYSIELRQKKVPRLLFSLWIVEWKKFLEKKIF